MSRIAVMGAGAWGTALALSLWRRGGHQIALWAHSPAVAATIRGTGENKLFLPGFAVPGEITVSSDVAEALAGAEIILSAMPSRHVRASYASFAAHLHVGQILVSATKGIEDRTLLRMSEVIVQVLAARNLSLPVAVLSGPSFAQELAAGAPTAVTIACSDTGVASLLQQEFGSGSLRLYTNDDVVGVELGGALKNVIALAAGVVAGLELGHNSAAALITRGIAETTRLAVACGGRRETLAGLSGMGDLILTCTGSLSRNRSVGIQLGRGATLADALAGLNGKVAEGVSTAFAALGLAERYGVEMPITSQVVAILKGERSPLAAIEELMARPGRDE
ncbi:MAG: NAD(P)-dependent glycerol-3-phosphate dehydrogenase [Acidobacteria bacterium]|nr:NAD(P)-dependent glycerol-3-phosphate dehydrogenase [Acidobacteriota bacterium]MBW4044969.1 NAD(P)-dependent glycerol-3-phosphate dehydrogenase [Acidobacteriota bacterium]